MDNGCQVISQKEVNSWIVGQTEPGSGPTASGLDVIREARNWCRVGNGPCPGKSCRRAAGGPRCR
jgi:hypothetical protein